MLHLFLVSVELRQSTEYNNVTTIRVSNDHFTRARWDEFLYASRLAGSLGVWPWADVFMSTEKYNLLLATLSAGIVGVGDPIGKINKGNLLHSVRADGVIVKPDTPVVPVDDLYIQDAKGLDSPIPEDVYCCGSDSSSLPLSNSIGASMRGR